MTLCTLGMSAEFLDYKIAVNSLWPKTIINTSAIKWMMGSSAIAHCREADIMADAAYTILTMSYSEINGQALLDEDVLRNEKGISNFQKYSCDINKKLYKDFFVD
jgi:citronellol/citronellal dehydrogenase